MLPQRSLPRRPPPRPSATSRTTTGSIASNSTADGIQPLPQPKNIVSIQTNPTSTNRVSFNADNVEQSVSAQPAAADIHSSNTSVESRVTVVETVSTTTTATATTTTATTTSTTVGDSTVSDSTSPTKAGNFDFLEDEDFLARAQIFQAADKHYEQVCCSMNECNLNHSQLRQQRESSALFDEQDSDVCTYHITTLTIFCRKKPIYLHHSSNKP